MRNSLDGEAPVLTPAQSYNVDGYHADSNTVYEYQGCIFYGCKRCFPLSRQKKRHCHPDRTIEEVYEATCLKTAILRDAGYTVIEKWGCDFAQQKKTDPELQTFLESFELVPPLEPRDAFFGGRTGATTLYAKAAEGEEISYVDFTSLYPPHQQIWNLSCAISRNLPQPCRSKYLPLFWYRSGRHPCA